MPLYLTTEFILKYNNKMVIQLVKRNELWLILANGNPLKKNIIDAILDIKVNSIVKIET